MNNHIACHTSGSRSPSLSCLRVLQDARERVEFTAKRDATRSLLQQRREEKLAAKREVWPSRESTRRSARARHPTRPLLASDGVCSSLLTSYDPRGGQVVEKLRGEAAKTLEKNRHQVLNRREAVKRLEAEEQERLRQQREALQSTFLDRAAKAKTEVARVRTRARLEREQMLQHKVRTCGALALYSLSPSRFAVLSAAVLYLPLRGPRRCAVLASAQYLNAPWPVASCRRREVDLSAT